jgi:hypothetical protein
MYMRKFKFGMPDEPSDDFRNSLRTFLSCPEKQLWHLTRIDRRAINLPDETTLSLDAHGAAETVATNLTHAVGKKFGKNSLLGRALQIELAILLEIVALAANGRCVDASLFSGKCPSDSNFFDISHADLTIFCSLCGTGAEYLESHAVNYPAFRDHQLRKLDLLETALRTGQSLSGQRLRARARELEVDFSYAALGHGSITEIRRSDIAVWRGGEAVDPLLTRIRRSEEPRLRFLAQVV